jgi:hypothetical protein
MSKTKTLTVCAKIGRGNYLFDLTGSGPHFITNSDNVCDECHQIVPLETEAKESA